ncbi:DUF2867 domain-containing protein [Allokutzneria albata]|uniref:DUF2867 domain-containing protein n=1 Tax=Allokutzneria albata TaxID=211114 RepID=A0A1G9STH9_ALLAB|nr:DUF2867 domain-containing protein [Allokutzneria albata]SDM38713.1 Protein of unknown function [Allokutzneria albata]
MKLPRTAHTSRSWAIHGIVGDFARLVELMTGGGDPSENWSRPARALWALRWKIGKLFGWASGARAASLRSRVPDSYPVGPDAQSVPFTSLYLLENEWAAEMSNRTVQSVTHLSWVPDGSGGHRGQMAVLVKPNGLFGRLYMAAIAPLRHLIVYPTMIPAIGREWRERVWSVSGEPRKRQLGHVQDTRQSGNSVARCAVAP